MTPEPDEDERAAIEGALRRLLTRDLLPGAYTSAWREAGLREAVSQALARPRSSRGATRA
jgi:hypothetical protein